MTQTLATLRQMAAGDGVEALQASLILWKFERPTYQEWVGLVEKAIAFEVSQIARRRSDLQGIDENGITALLVISLESLGLQASSAVANGNCDVVVSYAADYSWLGEAKIFTGVAAVWGGYLQLTARYAVGLPGQDRGGMLLYCYKDQASALLAEWRAALAAQLAHANVRDSVIPLTFSSDDVCQSTGLPLSIVHFAFPLLHEPQEDKKKLTDAAFAAGRKAKKRARQETQGNRKI